jgi:glycosyltransferase involved in cell wall biosynthesis
MEGAAQAGVPVRWLGSRDVRGLLENSLKPEEFFYRSTDRLFGSTRPAVRGACKAAEHLADMLRLIREARLSGAAAIHFQWSVMPDYDQRCWARLKVLGIRVLYTAHNFVPHDAGLGDRERYGKLCRLADRVLVHSRGTGLDLERGMGVSQSRIRIVPHPALKIPGPDITSPEAALIVRQWGICDDDKVVLLSGAIEHYKGPDLALEVMPRLVGRMPGTKLVLAGTAGRRMRDWLAERARTMGLPKEAVSLTGHLSNRQMKALVSRANVCIFPYRDISQSGAIMSALGEGKPLVAFDVGGLGQAVENGRNGFLVPGGDIGAFSDAVATVLGDRVLSRKMAAGSRELANERFSPRDCFLRNLEVYRELLDEEA